MARGRTTLFRCRCRHLELLGRFDLLGQADLRATHINDRIGNRSVRCDDFLLNVTFRWVASALRANSGATIHLHPYIRWPTVVRVAKIGKPTITTVLRLRFASC